MMMMITITMMMMMIIVIHSIDPADSTDGIDATIVDRWINRMALLLLFANMMG
jgi:hypothetical protein